jgi:signal transduction histidine kinase/ligand-binding sensor domain-containing protein
MWFGTADGLNKYDGYDVTVFRHRESDSSSLSSSTIRSIFEDHKGNLWIGTGVGLDRFDRETGKFARFTINRPGSGENVWRDISSIYEDTDGTLWLACNEGLDSFNPQTLKTSYYRSDPCTSIWSDGTRSIWAGSILGLRRVDRRDSVIVDVPFEIKQSERNLRGPGVFSIISDLNGGVVIGTYDQGIFAAKARDSSLQVTGRPADIPIKHVHALLKARNGMLWVGGFGEGLGLFDSSNGTVESFLPDPLEPASISSNMITCLCEDRSGLIWIGTDGGGVNKLDPHPKKFALYRREPKNPNSLSGNFVKSILEDHEGILWIGTLNEGLNRLDRRNQQWTHFRHDPSKPYSLAGNSVSSICEDGDGELWFGTEGGLDRLDRATGNFRHYGESFGIYGEVKIGKSVTALHVSDDGTIWVGTEVGFGKYERSTDRFTWFGTFLARSICPGPPGSLWIGGYSTLVKFNVSSASFKSYKNAPAPNQSISNGSVRSVAQSADGAFWFGTEEGLNRFDPPTGTFIPYYSQEGFPSDFVYAVMSDQHGNLWITTNEGVSRFDLRTRKFRNYGREDGLQSEEFNTGAYFQSKSGEMFFGGINGFNSFFPDSMKDNPTVPLVVITGFKKFDRETTLGGDIARLGEATLKYDETVFSLRFAGLEFTNPSKNQYAYKLEGFENDWIYGGMRREVRYTHLDPGDYVFRLKASNNDGVWNEQPLSVKIIIVPPFWKTPWFIGGSFLASLALIAGSARYISLRKLRRTVGRLEQEQALQRERARISKDMHDDVGASLTRISLLTEVAKREASSPGGIQSSIQQISDLAREVVTNLDEIVWAVNPKNDTLDSLATYITEYASTFFESAPIQCRFDVPDKIPSHHLTAEMRYNVFNAAKEALTNILKHSRATEVRMAFRLQGSSFELLIEDNGAGFIPEKISRFSNGLTNMRQRMADIKGTLSLSSKPGEGTTVKFQLPLPPS